MENFYKHRQVSWSTNILLVIIIGVLIASFFLMPAEEKYSRIIMIFPLVLILAVLLLFHSLTILVDQEKVTASFGPGLIKKSILFNEIVSAEVKEVPWYYGTGLRMIRGGWMYNAAVGKVVAVNLKDGKIYYFGSDEPEKLISVIKEKARV